jgi:Site-specific recombinases, DNA invertase Pin homologs
MRKTLACCYTRFSTDNQNQSSTIGQLRAIKSYCDRNNIELVDTYIDEAQSGTNMNRKNFQRMLADAPTAVWDTVVVYNMSRLSRSVKDALQIKDEFAKMGKKILSVIENQEETPEGDFFNLITFGLNELFVKQFKRDSWRGLLVNAKDAKALGGVPPYGFKISKDRKYEVNEEEAPVVRLIFDMVLKGFSYRDIATYLNSKGHTKRGVPWNHSFTDLLRNEKYKGVYVWNRREGKQKLGRKTNRITKPEDQIIRIPGGCPSIVDAEIFDKVQAILNHRTRQYAHKGPKTRYFLSGLLVCGKCGSAYTGAMAFSGRSKLRRDLYECCGRRRLHKCDAKDINMDYLDSYVTDLVNRLILPASNAPIYKDQVNKRLEAERRKIEDSICELDARKKALREESILYADRLGSAGEEEYVEITRLIGENSKERAWIDIEQSKLRERAVQMPKLTLSDVEKALSLHRARWKQEAKAELGAIVPKIFLDNGTITAQIDLKELLYGRPGDDEAEWILEIPINRERVSLGYRRENADFSPKRLLEAFKRKSSSHAGQ